MKVIPQDLLDRGYPKALHVEGWNKATRFFHIQTKEGVHIIRTSKKPTRTLTTKNNLLYTNRNQP